MPENSRPLEQQQGDLERAAAVRRRLYEADRAVEYNPPSERWFFDPLSNVDIEFAPRRMPPGTYEVEPPPPPPPVVADPPAEIVIPMAVYQQYGMFGGRVCPRNRRYCIVTRRDANSAGVPDGHRFETEADLPLYCTCEVCGRDIGPAPQPPQCEVCALRAAETATTVANGGRRFGIELEFSFPVGYSNGYDEDDPDYEPEDDDVCDCHLCRERRGNRSRAVSNGFGPASIAEAITAAGVPCVSPGYTHSIIEGHWKLVPDGSLMNGLELVSPPLQWDVAQDQVHTACAVLKELGCRSTSDCGLHVHHDVGDLRVSTARMLARNWDMCQSHSNRLVDPDRQYGDWCQPLPPRVAREMCNFEGDQLQHFFGIDGERYRPLNWTSWHSYGTVEVRMHESTLDPDEILSWVAYTQSIIEASMSGQEIPAPTDFSDLVDHRLTIRQAARPAHTRQMLKAKAMRNA